MTDSPAERLIKKYKNRRLYDMALSQYITIEDLQKYVIDGVLFRVIDATSHADITNSVLLQIFVEIEAETAPFLSSEVLRQLIVLACHPLNQSFKPMLEHMVRLMQTEVLNQPYANDFQKASDVWRQQIQVFMKQWQV